MHALQHHENFYGTTRSTTQIQPDLLHALTCLRGHNGSYGKAFGENPVLTRSEKPFPDIDLLFVLNLLNLTFPRTAIEHAMNVVRLRFDTHFEGRIRDEKHLRNQRVNGYYFAHNPLGGNHSHSLFDLA